MGMLALIIGGIWALNEYSEKHKAERVKETLSYVDVSREGAIFESQAKVGKVWRTRSKELTAAAKKGGVELTALILSTVETADLEPSIHTLMSFYQSLQVC